MYHYLKFEFDLGSLCDSVTFVYTLTSTGYGYSISVLDKRQNTNIYTTAVWISVGDVTPRCFNGTLVYLVSQRLADPLIVLDKSQH